ALAEKAIAPGQPGRVVMVLLGSDDLDVTQVELSSLSYRGVRAISTETADTNGDGRPDLMITFDASEMRALPSGQRAFLSGWLKTSQEFVGQVRVVERP